MSCPRISIGLPVYNGENFVAEAIESILAQTYGDWELVISDNASTDGSQAICQAYAAADARIRYHRATENQGVAWNFNRAFELARGEFFKWAAHDDLNAPTQLERCMALLDANPTAVLAGFQTAVIDEQGEQITADGTGDGELQGVPEWKNQARLECTASHQAWRRYYGLLLHSIRCYEVFGLMRSSAIRRTRLHGAYRGSEKVFLGEMALQGKFIEAPEVLFFSRWHTARYSAEGVSATEQQTHFNPRASRRFAWPFQFRVTWEHFRAIGRAPVSFTEASLCRVGLARFMLQLGKWPKIAQALFTNKGDNVALPPTVRRLGRHPNCPPRINHKTPLQTVAAERD